MKKRMMLLGILLAGGITLGTTGGYIEESQQEETGLFAGVTEAGTEWMTGQNAAALARNIDIDPAEEEFFETEEELTVAADSEAENVEEESFEGAVVAEHEVPLVASEYADIAIAQVNNYVNVRALPSTESEVLGKLYNKSAATVLETTEDGWYRIESGNVEGYVKSEYVVVGDEELARAVSTRYATVTTTTLFVRSEPTTESSVLTMLPEGDDLVALDESVEGWVKVATVEGDGYVSADYVNMSTEYIHAESKAEEEARLAREEAERQAAIRAAEEARRAREAEEAARRAQEEAAKKQQSSAASRPSGTSGSSNSGSSNAGSNTGSNSGNNNAGSSNAGGSTSSVSNGQAVVDYGMKFLGNPYVYGGNSLTNGTDCSGFVKGVYAAFGINLPRTSAEQRNVGYGVSLDAIQPGDIVCYSGHVGIYAGNNTLLHASNEKTGITLTSPVTYRKVLAVRRIF